MRIVRIAIAGLVAAFCIGASPADAAGTVGFKGSCTFVGTDTFSPALTLQPGPGSARAEASGHCTGTLRVGAVAQSVRQAEAAYVGSTTSTSISCAGGSTAGVATITIAGHAIRAGLNEPQVTAVTALFLNGDGGGSALGVAWVSPRAVSVPLVTSCMGSGISSIPVTISVNTGLAELVD